jgi:isoleucyl-tRNA synthetase
VAGSCLLDDLHRHERQSTLSPVLTHGFTVDGQGRKMSKSIGNTVSPQDVMNKLGADILRLWVASTDYTGEMAVSDEILKRAADSYRRIRNTARFLLANLNGFDPVKDMVKPEEMVVLDRWAVGVRKRRRKILKAYEAYDFHEVVQRLMRFCSRNGFVLPRHHQRPSVHRESGQRGASQLPDCAVPHCRSAGTLDGADHVLHR